MFKEKKEAFRRNSYTHGPSVWLMFKEKREGFRRNSYILMGLVCGQFFQKFQYCPMSSVYTCPPHIAHNTQCHHRLRGCESIPSPTSPQPPPPPTLLHIHSSPCSSLSANSKGGCTLYNIFFYIFSPMSNCPCRYIN